MTSILFARRASALLYRILLSRPADRAFVIPANVCAVVPLTFRLARRSFRVVDVGATTCSLDEQQCLDLIRSSSGNIGGVLYVRSYGREEESAESFFRQLREMQPGLFIIDDKCLCRPDTTGSRVAASADATLHSTGYAKYTDLGIGGFAHVRDDIEVPPAPAARYSPAAHEEVIGRCRRAIASGTPFRDVPEGWLDLEPLDDPESYLRAVDAATAESDERKRELNAIYRSGIPAEAQMHESLHDWRFNISVGRPDVLMERLFAAGLFASRHYPSVGAAFEQGEFPVAAGIHRRVVNLFNDRYYDAGRARRTVEVVRSFLQEPTSSRSRSSSAT